MDCKKLTKDGKVWDYVSNENDKLAKQVKKDKSIVMTKPEMAKELVARISFQDGDRVLEPCKGDGAFYNSFPDNVEKLWCEINEGRDFLTYDISCDYIIANPPFVPRKLFWSFMERSMDITTKGIYWLINMSSLNVFTPRRLDIMKEKGWFIQSFHIVSDRRWFGRYVFVEITREPSEFITFKRKTY